LESRTLVNSDTLPILLLFVGGCGDRDLPFLGNLTELFFNAGVVNDDGDESSIFLVADAAAAAFARRVPHLITFAFFGFFCSFCSLLEEDLRWSEDVACNDDVLGDEVGWVISDFFIGGERVVKEFVK